MQPEKQDETSPLKKKYTGETIEGSQFRKKKRTNDLKDVRTGGRFAKNEFIERRSLLDQFYLDSSISQSPFKGLIRIAFFACFIYIVNNICVINDGITV